MLLSLATSVSQNELPITICGGLRDGDSSRLASIQLKSRNFLADCNDQLQFHLPILCFGVFIGVPADDFGFIGSGKGGQVVVELDLLKVWDV